MNEPLWTPTDVAKYLRVSRTLIYEWMADGILPMIELGPRTKRFEPDAIREWAKQRATMNDSERAS